MAKEIWISLLMTLMFSTVGFYWFMYRRRRVQIPIKWRQVGKVEDIIMYPLKSGALRRLKEAKCSETGLADLQNADKFTLHDRCFVLYDQQLKPVRLLSRKTMCRISVESVDRDTLIFSAPNMKDFVLKLSEFLSSPRKVELNYGISMEAVDCGDEVSKWMSQYLLGTCEGYRLGYFMESVCQRRSTVEVMKHITPKLFSMYNAKDDDSVFFADVASYMILTSESVEDVNAKLPPEDRFKVGNLRPNIVVSGSEKYAEDSWKWIKIGDNVIMKRIKPCTRCYIVTINPDNGLANKNLQPLKLLKTYRSVKHLEGHEIGGNSPILGSYVGLYIPGIIKLGDPVYTNA